MTIIKQQSVTGGTSHQKNLRNYINNDEKVILRASQNMEMCPDIKQWASFMKHTREMFGHNKASRKGKDGKEAKNTILYHQILGFNPDECDVNGGILSPQNCMNYAKEYASSFYPNYEIVFALHNEFCQEDKTYRYAVHMVINRSNLETGKRLDEGLGVKAKKERARRVRSMDEAWGLKQVEEGKINSAIHHRQRSRVEKELEKKGIFPYKTNLRELVRIAGQQASSLVDFRALLDGWGVDTEFRNGRMYARDRDNDRYSFSVIKLDAHLESFARDTDREHEQLDYVAKAKNDYLMNIRSLYVAYRKEVQGLPADKVAAFPKLVFPKPPKDIADDSSVKREILAYWRGADELRRARSSQKTGRDYMAKHLTRLTKDSPQRINKVQEVKQKTKSRKDR